jgi:hypothetical protein
MSISADSYPSRNSGNNSSGDSGGDLDRFVSQNVSPSMASAGPSDSTPDRPTVQPEDLHHDPSKVPAGTETLGAMYSPQTTLRHDAAHEPGMPAGFTSAKNPLA